jgi:uncharacterized membrane protein
MEIAFVASLLAVAGIVVGAYARSRASEAHDELRHLADRIAELAREPGATVVRSLQLQIVALETRLAVVEAAQPAIVGAAAREPAVAVVPVGVMAPVVEVVAPVVEVVAPVVEVVAPVVEVVAPVVEVMAPVVEVVAPVVEVPAPAAARTPTIEPPSPPRPSFEELIGKRWTTWIGAVALIIGVGLFVNVAVDRGWLGPASRTALAAAFGIGLIVVGERRRAMRALSQGLVGAGVAILYVAAFAGFAHYELYGHGVGFVSLLGITAVGMALALRHDASPIAVLALIGGFLAPILISSGDDHRDALCIYLAVLDLGVLGIAFSKRWRILEVLALIGTWSLYSGWYVLHGAASAPAPALGWLLVFHTIFVILPFVYHVRRRQPLDVARFVAALSGAMVGFGYSAHMLADEPHALGVVALGLAASYLVMGILIRRLIPADARATFAFLTLVTGFVTLAGALLLTGHATTIAWAVEGPVLVSLGYHYGYRPARISGLFAVALATGRVFLDGWPAHPGAFTPFLNGESRPGCSRPRRWRRMRWCTGVPAAPPGSIAC